MDRRNFLRTAGSLLLTSALMPGKADSAEKKKPLNILLFTADDMNGDSLGCFGNKVPDISPNLDKFAAQGIRFTYGYNNAAICQPSRGVLATGLYGHNSGIMGFMHTEKNIPTIMETLRKAGYLTGILGKVKHSTPKESYKWDFVHDQNELGSGRDPAIYYKYCKEFLGRCRKENKPFYFMVNSHDPHRPFHIPGKPMRHAAEPSRTYKPAEVIVPGFIPDLPEVREEISYYFNSVRRCDDTFGKTMQALKETGFEENTLVTFLSDNGIAVPFAKCNVYLASNRTPWITRWPGVINPGSADSEHFVSEVDYFPTVMDAAGIQIKDKFDGFSYVPLLKGQKQENRDRVFTQIDSKVGNIPVPMRSIQNKQFGYIFNGWSDGEYWYKNSNEGMTLAAMEKAAKTDPSMAERVKMYRYRALEEFYDLQKDPDCLNNLINNSKYKEQVRKMQAELQAWMIKTGDPVLKAYEKRQSPKEMKKEFVRIYGDKFGKSKANGSKRKGGRDSKKNKEEDGE